LRIIKQFFQAYHHTLDAFDYYLFFINFFCAFSIYINFHIIYSANSAPMKIILCKMQRKPHFSHESAYSGKFTGAISRRSSSLHQQMPAFPDISALIF
jgi:hypothetical protein